MVGCDYDSVRLLEKAKKCEEVGIDPEYILILANECCGPTDFYNPVDLLYKVMECKDFGYDPVKALESFLIHPSTPFQPVHALSEVIKKAK